MFELDRRALKKAALPAAASFTITFGAGVAVMLFLATGGLSDSRKDLPAADWFGSAAGDFSAYDASEPAPGEPTARPARTNTFLAANETSWLLLPGEADRDFVVAESLDDPLSPHERNDAAVAPDAPYESYGADLLEGADEALPAPEIADPPLPEP
jgi:hypothetical protein